MAWFQKLGAPLWPAVSDGAAIYVSSTTTLEGLSPADGRVLWASDFGNVFGIGQPTVADGHVFIAQCNNTPGTYMYSFVASTGQLFWSQPFPAQWDHFWAPLVVGGRVYFDGGQYGGFYALSESSGGQLFFEKEDQWDSWSPTYVDGSVYTFTNGNVRAFDPVGGSLVQSTTVPWNSTSYAMNTSPVSDGTSLYIISPPNLYAFAPGLGSPLWTANGAYSGQPAVANGVVYSISGGQFRANDASTGALLWSFMGDSSLKYPPAVAAGFVYVASEANVYALDVAQHTQAWTATPGGWLSIAGGRLLVAEQSGTLAAWSLSQ
jgi:hypothetical protein